VVSYNEITFDISCETEQGIDSVRFQDTDHYRTTVRFLQNPESAMEDILGKIEAKRNKADVSELSGCFGNPTDSFFIQLIVHAAI
jgi:hypothetical protein